MAKQKKKKSISLILRNYFITGVVVLIPIGFTLYLSKILIGISSKVIPENINPNSYLPFEIPGLEIILSVIFITIVGGLSLSFLGKRILKLIDDLFKRIPVLRTIYSAIVQMTETFSNKGGGDFQESPDEIPFKIIKKSENNISFVVPNKKGFYRVFVFLKNNLNQSTVANIPFRVDGI